MPDENGFVEIGSVLVNPEILTRPYTCDVPKYGCNSRCCYRACIATPEEAARIDAHLEGILPYLSPENREAITSNGSVLADCSLQCPTGCVVHEEEALALKRVNNGAELRCVLLFNNNCSLLYRSSEGHRYCAVHSYALEKGLAWETFKFSDCVQYPLMVYAKDDGRQVLTIQDTPYLKHIPCLNKPSGEPMYQGLKKVIEVLLGKEFYRDLSAYAGGRSPEHPGSPRQSARRNTEPVETR